MNDFEKEYYEDPSFWEGNMLQDEQNLTRFKLTSSFIKDDVTSLLDVGCGNGVFLHFLQNEKPSLKTHGLDRSEKALEFVKTAKTVGDGSNLPFDNNAFDCVSCLEVIEHLPLPVYEKTLKELCRVAGKYIIISVPYKEVLEDSYTCCPSCKSIFNYELHLRSFDDEKIIHLLEPYKFKNVKLSKTGLSSSYLFHREYVKIFYRERLLQWSSPICPICGYNEPVISSNKPGINGQQQPKRKWISYLSALPKKIWPQKQKYYWIIGLYERVTL